MNQALYHLKWIGVGLAVILFVTGTGAFIVKVLGGHPSL